MTSDARVKCVPSTMIIGVGCGKSYTISYPTRSFIQLPSRLFLTNGYETAGYKAIARLFDQIRAIRQKAIAICRERVQGIVEPQLQTERTRCKISRRVTSRLKRRFDSASCPAGTRQRSAGHSFQVRM